MEENKIEEIVEETTQETKKETPKKEGVKKDNVTKVNLKKFKSEKPKDDVYKVDLSKPPNTEEDVQSESTDTNKEDVVQEKTVEETTNKEEVTEQTTEENTEKPVVEEITGEEKEEEEKIEKIADEAEEAIKESIETGKALPENIQSLIDFMEETGGSLEDYVKLNQDYSKLDDKNLLYEYYKQTKPHLDNEEINFLMEDSFSYNEEEDDDKEIRRKKLALKEQVASAKNHLDGLKSKYYRDLKAGSRLTPEQQKAQDFFNRYKKTTEESRKNSEKLAINFDNKTNEFFGDKFKGFEYNVGDKKFRFNVNDTNEIKDAQSDVRGFIGKFLNEKTGALEDAAGYHKSLFTAMNADTIAKHFYEQGRADAMKNSVAKSKNISMDPRQSHGEAQSTGGMKFKVLGDDSASFKWKIKNKSK